ncbi:MAG: C10 family peptidase, partial [Muribaculaceae bacterium]|nr:C10 family peptidase [Muribaculaceae bacterium]
MNKIFVTLIVIATMCATAGARQLTPNEALARATGELANSSPKKIRALASTARLSYTAASEGKPGVYVMTDPTAEGFIAVSADDIAIPILGYSETGIFNADNMPDNMRYWLNEYTREIAWASKNGIDPGISLKTVPERETIPTMCATQWGQGSPYNDLCPINPSTGKPYATGCTATALAQVMKYHAWPERGSGSYSYVWNDETLSFDYENTVFDWDNMTNTYSSSSTDAQKKAVATLMIACGFSINMHYTPMGSDGKPANIPDAISKYFGYANTATQFYRTYFTLEQWEELIYNQLKNVGPLLYHGLVTYSGEPDNMGHVFTCDGYSSDGYFHFNWGWSGSYHGFFKLSAVNPYPSSLSASGFEYHQNVLVNIQKPSPEAKQIHLMSSVNFKITDSIVELGHETIFTGGMWNIGTQIIPQCATGLIVENTDSCTSYFHQCVKTY